MCKKKLVCLEIVLKVGNLKQQTFGRPLFKAVPIWWIFFVLFCGFLTVLLCFDKIPGIVALPELQENKKKHNKLTAWSNTPSRDIVYCSFLYHHYTTIKTTQHKHTKSSYLIVKICFFKYFILFWNNLWKFCFIIISLGFQWTYLNIDWKVHESICAFGCHGDKVIHWNIQHWINYYFSLTLNI